LRKIPVLGALFSRTEERQQNSEIIVLITPTLIDTPDSDWQRREISRVQTIESEISAVPSQLVE
jgi:type II secretory pathway component GspD/PulD (secretin)